MSKRPRSPNSKPHNRKSALARKKGAFQKGSKVSVGNKGNKGRETLNIDDRAALLIDRNVVQRFISANFNRTIKELELILKKGEVHALEAITISVIIRAYYSADVARFEFLLDRLIGRVKQSVDLNVNVNPYANMSDEELLKKKQELMERNRATLSWIEKTQRSEDVVTEARTLGLIEVAEDSSATEG